jgi:hypothetical protein
MNGNNMKKNKLYYFYFQDEYHPNGYPILHTRYATSKKDLRKQIEKIGLDTKRMIIE